MPAQNVSVSATFEPDKVAFSDTFKVTVDDAKKEVGTELTATVAAKAGDSPAAPEEQLTYQWYRANDAQGTGEAAIDTATEKTYTLADDDLGKYVYVKVTYTGDEYLDEKTIASAKVGPVEPKVVFAQNFDAVSEADPTDPSHYGFTATNNDPAKAVVEDGKLKVSGGGTSSSPEHGSSAVAVFDSPATGNKIVKVSFDWDTGNTTGTARRRAVVALQDSQGKNILKLSYEDLNYKVNDVQVEAGGSGNTKQGTVTAVINLSMKTITSLSFSGHDNFTKENLQFLDPEAGAEVAKFFVEDSAKANWLNTTTVDNIKITEEKNNIVQHKITYEFKYVEGDGDVETDIPAEDLPQDITKSAVVTEGEDYQPEYQQSFQTDAYTYTYKSGADKITGVDSEKTVKLVYTRVERPKYTATVNAVKSGGEDTPLTKDGEPIKFEATQYTGQSVKVYYNKYIDTDDGFYMADEETFGKEFSAEGSENVTYTKADNVVYFVEGEKVDNANAGGNDAQYSGGQYGRVNTGKHTISLQAGTYNVIVKIADDKSRGEVLWNDDILVSFYAKGKGGSATLEEGNIWKTENVTVEEGKVLTIGHDREDDTHGSAGSTTATDEFDYIVVETVAGE